MASDENALRPMMRASPTGGFRGIDLLDMRASRTGGFRESGFLNQMASAEKVFCPLMPASGTGGSIDSEFLNQMPSGENVRRAMKHEGNDRFSRLPDALAHCILSFVNVDEFGWLMLVSKRFNQLCFSAPSLSMVNSSSTGDDTHHRAKLDRFLTAYFFRRSLHGANVQRISILWSFHHQANPQKDCDEDDPVFTCLCRCVAYCDPDHVDLNLVLREGACFKIKVPLIFACVRNLALSMNNTGIMLPNDTFPSRLESLTLKSVIISCKSDVLFSTPDFPKLKRLRLYECSGMESLHLWNGSLERVEIRNLKSRDLCYLVLGCFELRTLLLTWLPKSGIGELRLYVPKMERLDWVGYPLECIDFGLPEQLKNATVCCTLPPTRSLDDYFGDFNLELIVESVRIAKSLSLFPQTIEIIIKLLSKKSVLPSFEGVETLHIHLCDLIDVEVPAIAFLLKMMAGLKNIYLSSSKIQGRGRSGKNKVTTRVPSLEVSGFKMDYWEAQDLKFVQQLETATVEIGKEQGNATELVKYFAKHGEHLENLKVICPSAMVSAFSGQIEEAVKRNVNVIYVEPVELGGGIIL